MTDDLVTNDAASATNGMVSAFNVIEHETLPGHLYFWTRPDWKGDIPPEQHELLLAFDEVCAVLRARFQQRSPEKFKNEFNRLLKLAQATFSGELAQILHGSKSLEAYKIELVNQEGPAIKNDYLKELAKAAFIASLLIISVASFFKIGICFGEKYQFITTELSGAGKENIALSSIKWNAKYSPMHFGFLLASTMWGIWLSFVVRNMNLRFEQLQNPESDLMRPWSRLLAFGLLAFILALFFQMQVLVISVGWVSTNQISDDLLIAIFVGLCLGFTDKALPGEAQRRIEEFFQSTKK